MDKLTRDILIGLLKLQASFLQSQAGLISILVAESSVTANRVRAAVEASVLISRLDDPVARRGALDALWVAMDGPPQSTAEKASSEISRAAAKLDRQNDILAVGVENLVKGLQSIPLDGE